MAVVLFFGIGIWLAQGKSSWSELLTAGASHEPMPWKLVMDPQRPAPALPEAPEPMVRQIYQHLGEGQRHEALTVAQHLVSLYPTFQLGQLLYADLLNMGLREPVDGPEVSQEVLPAAQKRLEELLRETTRRLRHPPLPNIQDKIPSGLLHLDPQLHPYVAFVDASHSRLYWFANRSDAQGQPRLELLMDTYISVGVQGIGKSREGDGRTPLGVYFIKKNLSGDTLPDLFGAGALTLNYPNAVDLMRKRTGSGIWLHGTPSAQYSRAPEATDGCVVLSNPEMSRLLALGSLRLTPVLIGRDIDWQQPEQAETERNPLMSRLQAWNQARQQDNDPLLRGHYSERFEREGQGLDHWWPKLRSPVRNRTPSKPLNLVSALRWQDEGELMVVTWLDPNRSTSQRNEYLRNYWAKEGGRWKIVFEGPV
ncbi:MAG: murein L,D-transpeptidase family protein [Limnohabitans sp.]